MPDEISEQQSPASSTGDLSDFIEMVQSGKDIGEILDSLGQELFANGFIYLEKIRRGQKIEEAEEVKQNEMQKQFKFLKSLYIDMIKMDRIKGGTSANPNEKFNAGFLQKVKEKKSTMGEIISTIPK